MSLANVTFIHESEGLFKKFVRSITIKIGRQKFKLRNNDSKTINLEPGRHKIRFIHGKPLIGWGGLKLRSRIRLEDGEKVTYRCGIRSGPLRRKEIFYEVYDG